MEKFNGFPAGELRFTSVPDLFFARLLPEIDSLAELKVTLHFLWVHYRQARQVIARNELLADETLVHSLALLDEDIEHALTQGLTRAVERGTLLYARVEDEAGLHDLYFLNSERGRQAQAKVEAGEMGVVAVSGAEIVTPTKRANIFDLYEANIGLLSPIIVDELKDAEATYPQIWIEDAFKIAVENNVRKWSYIRAILQRMAIAGRDDGQGKTDDSSKPWYTDEEFKQLIQH
ncbi:MAG TPA: DnaD domain protein [Anaerolineae bacterium]|nr:DnaD domain protein [Anaerolineae bacterium]HXW00110.1 DnaD domain protein [Anaerolineae bacterium]